MRIITGTLKGRRIQIPKTLNVRPTTDRCKEGMFSAIEARKYLEGASVLDLFAGSGNLGFEAISRGAERVLFVDSDRNNLKNIEKTAQKFDVADQIRTHCAKIEDYIEGPAVPYDLIFCDPPYTYPLIGKMIDRLLEGSWLKEDGWMIVEHDKHHDYTEHPHCFFSRAYGRTTVSIFTPNPEIFSPDND